VAAQWLCILVFLAYLSGPSRAPEDPPRDPALTTAIAAPVNAFVKGIYEHVPTQDRARWADRLIGAVLTTAAVTLTFLALQRIAPKESALILALMAAFASPLWSWTSRANTPETAWTLGAAALVWLSVSYGTYVVVWSAAGAVTTALLALGIAHGAFDPEVAAAYLVSPGRGLVFYAPLFVLALVALARRGGPRNVVVGGALVLLAGLDEIAGRADPWGPMGFGPTQFAPYIPLLAVMAAGLPRVWLRVGALLSLPALSAHGAAIFAGGHAWDERRAVAQHHEAVWDLSDSPFADLVFGAPRPDPRDLVAVHQWMRPGDYITRAGRPAPWLVYGWEGAEAKGVWASGRESWLVLGVPPGDYQLTLIASAPQRRGRNQSLLVERPGEPPLELEFQKKLWDLEPLAIPFRAERNITVLKLRPAHTWMPGHGDVRPCSVFLAALRLERRTAELVPIVLATERGSIELGVDLQRAPATARNFLRYVDAEHYDGGIIHRTVKLDNQPGKNVLIEVIQGGVNPARQKDGFGPIAIERTRDTGLAHHDGTLSMARDGPDTATSDFFICIGEQPSLDFGGKRNPDGQGFAAFGRVVSGMDVVRAIQRAPAEGQRLTPPVRILSARRR